MPDNDTLLIPIRLDALVVGRAFEGVLRTQRYQPRAALDFSSPEPEPFVPSADLSDQRTWGVRLMWTLPPALTHARADEEDGRPTQFPLVPNRWLVVRRLTPAGGGAAPSTMTWMIESDYLDVNGGTIPFIDPSATTLSEKSLTNLGRKVVIDADGPWTETPLEQRRQPFLQAVGPGDLTFAGFQPGNENVFSMHDDMTGIDEGRADYFVLGWYADGLGDPLADAAGKDSTAISSLLGRLRWDDGWSRTSEDPSGVAPPTPTRSAYHGLVLGVEWHRTGAPPADPREDAQPRLALGRSSSDALSAFLQTCGYDESVCRLLDAFLADDLDALGKPEGAALVRRHLHDSWFGAVPGGVQWAVVDVETSATQRAADDGESDDPAVDAPAWLADLNRSQAALDEQRRLLTSMQRELFEMWWKAGYADWSDRTMDTRPFGIDPQRLRNELDPAVPSSLAARVAGLQQSVEQAQKDLPAPTSDAPGLPSEQFARAKGLPEGRQLVAQLAPRFATASDPVLLLAGLAHSMVMDPTGLLRCRYVDEVITSYSVTQSAGRTATTLDELTLPEVAIAVPPAPLRQLLGEFELLRSLAAFDRDGFAARMTSIGSFRDQKALDSARDVDGVLGVPPEVPLQMWQQPWQPLFVEWEAEWHPIAHSTADGTENWMLGDEDLILARSLEPETPGSEQTYNGRAVLTPGLAFTVRRKLEEFVGSHADATDTARLLQQVQEVTQWDFLSQTLDGLNTQLAWRDHRATISPDPTIQPLLGRGRWTAPQSRQEDAPHHATHPPSSAFDGLRAGQLALTRLAVVDRFGRVLDVPQDTLVQVAVRPSEQPEQRVHADVQLQMPPRVLQGARLLFTATVPDDAKTPGNPYLGFVLPHHLEDALQVHGPAGELLGLVRRADSPGTPNPWAAEGIGSLDSLEALRSSHEELAQVIGGVTASGQSGFDEFLGAIDDARWTIDPQAGAQDDYLAALVGRPLAVVRVELRLDLDGASLTDPGWPYTFDAEPRTLLASRAFDVRLGAVGDREDGLVGYFTGSSYDTFHSVSASVVAQSRSAGPGFVVPASPKDLRVSFAADSVATATVLVDPRAQIHACTGLLPTTRLRLPQHRMAAATHAMPITVSVGPLLAAGLEAAPTVPTPRASRRGWTWIGSGPQGSQRGALPFDLVDDRGHFGANPMSAIHGLTRIAAEEENP